MDYIHFLYLVAAYGEGTYGTSIYGDTAADPGLAGTGFDVLLPVFLAISLIAASLILLARRLLRARRQRQEGRWAGAAK